MASITGDGTRTTIIKHSPTPKLMTLWYLENNIDGSPFDQDHDTVLSGGDLQFSTAKGITEEIIIYGDGFAFTTSKGLKNKYLTVLIL